MTLDHDLTPSSMNATLFLFVYGTLRKDANHPAHKIYLSDAEFVGRASVQAHLYMIDYYPGLVLDAETEHSVVGEVYALQKEMDWQRLDVYEACSPTCAQPHEYQRRNCWATLENGEQLTVWTYEFIQPIDGFRLIPSGDFLKLPL